MPDIFVTVDTFQEDKFPMKTQASLNMKDIFVTDETSQEEISLLNALA
jgi:hypothetical protein